MFERTSDHQRGRMDAPQQSPSMHQTPFYVFPRFDKTKIVTLPDAQLIEGRRNAVTSDADNAIKIAQMNTLTVTELPLNKETNEKEGRLSLPMNNPGIGYGYVVDVAENKINASVADFTVADTQSAETNVSFELHDPASLLERYENDPDRQKAVAIVRILGAFMLRKP
jgi:hypothetical protein